MAFGNARRPWIVPGTEIRSLRKRTGLSQIAAAKALGICTASLKNYEHGKYPAPKGVITLLQVLAAKRESLITGKRRDILEYIDATFDISL